ncbi:MAG TPA: DUF4912 domain-containing protein [Bacilli bacterium]
MNSIRYTIPDVYNKDMLQILVRDPSCLFLYWEISERKKAMVKQHFSSEWTVMPKFIRLYTADTPVFNDSTPQIYHDFSVECIDSCYIHQLKPNTNYIADYGITNSHGQFIPLIRSNSAQTPRNTPYRSGEEAGVHHPSNPAVQIKPVDYERFSAYSLYGLEGSST